jgi:hypothetical protein
MPPGMIRRVAARIHSVQPDIVKQMPVLAS